MRHTGMLFLSLAQPQELALLVHVRPKVYEEEEQ